MIRVQDMYKTYQMGENAVHALNGVSLHIREHEFVAIIGASGSGKSTLMNMLGCLDTPNSGDYWLDNVEVSQLNDNELADIRNLKIGFIFQQFNLLQKLTAVENTELPLIYQNIGSKERHRRAKLALEQVGLGDRIHHRPNELSGGQQQRVAIARALVTNPPLLLADEPTGNLDSRSGIEILQMLRKLHDSGNTIVIITHDQGIAEEANRIIRLQDGQIVEDRGLR
jgi:putative ABC transport system ATP-binding protein